MLYIIINILTISNKMDLSKYLDRYKQSSSTTESRYFANNSKEWRANVNYDITGFSVTQDSNKYLTDKVGYYFCINAHVAIDAPPHNFTPQEYGVIIIPTMTDEYIGDINLVQWKPDTSIGSKSYSDSVSLSVGGSIGFFGDTLTGSVSSSVTMSHGSSTSVSDLTVENPNKGQYMHTVFKFNNNTSASKSAFQCDTAAIFEINSVTPFMKAYIQLNQGSDPDFIFGEELSSKEKKDQLNKIANDIYKNMKLQFEIRIYERHNDVTSGTQPIIVDVNFPSIVYPLTDNHEKFVEHMTDDDNKVTTIINKIDHARLTPQKSRVCIGDSLYWDPQAENEEYHNSNNILSINTKCKQSTFLQSQNTRWTLELSEDGIPCIKEYDNDVGWNKDRNKRNMYNTDKDEYTWEVSTTNALADAPYSLKLLNNRTLVVYNSDNIVRWVCGGKLDQPNAGFSRLTMQNDGNLVIYDENNKPTWSRW
jgi:hypothetical protein